MASEEHDTGAVSFAVPQAVDSWIDDQATRRGQTRDEFCRQLLATVHAATSGAETESMDPIDRNDSSDPNDPIDRDELEELGSHVDEQRAEFVDLLEDVRERVIQVKRETDAKAATDHDHREYATNAAFEELRATLAALEDELATVRETTDDGFDDVETILAHVLEETRKLEDRSTALATAVVALRDNRDELVERERHRADVERLQLAANRLGVRRAACAACSSSVSVGLLTRPECPHCGRSVIDVEKKTSLFGSHTLVTADPPALDGDLQRADDSSPSDHEEAEPSATSGTREDSDE